MLSKRHVWGSFLAGVCVLVVLNAMFALLRGPQIMVRDTTEMLRHRKWHRHSRCEDASASCPEWCASRQSRRSTLMDPCLHRQIAWVRLRGNQPDPDAAPIDDALPKGLQHGAGLSIQSSIHVSPCLSHTGQTKADASGTTQRRRSARTAATAAATARGACTSAMLRFPSRCQGFLISPRPCSRSNARRSRRPSTSARVRR